MLKYGILSHSNKSVNFAENIDKEEINIGDYIQSIGVKIAYHKIGIIPEKIVTVEKYSISGEHFFYGDMDDEYVVTLNNVYSGGGSDKVLNPFPTSRNIIPNFIGFNCLDESMIAENVEYLKKWSPIGCRDEKTKEILNKYNINSYLTGCSSILLPERKENEAQNKVFFVDIPESLKCFIPTEYQKNAVFKSQNMLKNSFPECKDDLFFQETIKQLETYRNEAKLVVTSKLHCAAPCLAMGIPVILAVENVDYRFAWIDKLLPIYTNWKDIDWKIVKRDISRAKELLLDVYKNFLSEPKSENDNVKIESLKKIDDFYMNRNRSYYNNEKVEFLKQTLKELSKNLNKRNLKVLIWGAGKTGGLIFDLISKEFPEVVILGFIDSYKIGFYKDKNILKPDDIIKYDYDYIFLCSIPGRQYAIERMKILGLKQNENYVEFYFESVVERKIRE